MTTKLNWVLAVLCVGALSAPAAMATPTEFVPSTPNLPEPTKPVIKPMNPAPFEIPEPGSLPLVALAALAAAAALRRKK